MTRCPNCGDAMIARRMAGVHAGVEIDVCYSCHAFWFDALESPGLAEPAVLDLFGQIHEHRDQPRKPIGARLGCPRCRAALTHTQDFQRGNRIEYDRCPKGHGRFTTFYQFLREKHFVRSLTTAELKDVSVRLGQVRCSSCGATISLEKSACAHCGAPVSVIDADAVGKRLLAGSSANPQPRPAEPRRRPPPPSREPEGSLHDLLVDSVGTLAEWLGD